jgi:hypothetical protein
MHRLDHGADVRRGVDAGSVKAVRSGLGIRLEPHDRHIDIGKSDEKTLGSSDQHHVAAGGIDGESSRTHALDGGLERKQPSPGNRILDRQSGDAGLHREAHAFADAGRIRGKAVLEVRVQRQIGRGGHHTKMLQDLTAPHAVVGQALRPRGPRARACQRLESEALQ